MSVIGIFSWMRVVCVCAVVVSMAASALAGEISAGGTGSSAPLLRLLANEYAKSVPAFRLKLIEPPLGSGGALRALATGKIDLAVSGRPLKSDEIAALGRSIELARMPFVLVTKDGFRPKGFSLRELADVYKGKITHWDNGAPLRLILRSAFESDTEILRHMSADMDLSMQVAFERKGMAFGENDLDALNLVERIPGAMAPATLGLISTLGKNLRVLPLDGLTPSTKAIANGSYPWFKPLYVVLGKAPGPAVKGFVGFLSTPRAREILLRHEYLPSSE
ncbi:MAG: PstS family phosphate ABC transporter substrate-binding protein [Desulfuromonadaceae bacterium]